MRTGRKPRSGCRSLWGHTICQVSEWRYRGRPPCIARCQSWTGCPAGKRESGDCCDAGGVEETILLVRQVAEGRTLQGCQLCLHSDRPYQRSGLHPIPGEAPGLAGCGQVKIRPPYGERLLRRRADHEAHGIGQGTPCANTTVPGELFTQSRCCSQGSRQNAHEHYGGRRDRRGTATAGQLLQQAERLVQGVDLAPYTLADAAECMSKHYSCKSPRQGA
mmetsp:Transcript_2923/g.7421  ORF Transcript_2923/g.7421 Transcript_2923/m.7421 type:complete len:219 (-) Transcript_2923:880-1536(-)